MFNPIPHPFPRLGKGAALEDIPPSHRWKIEQPGPPVKGTPPINGGADAPLKDSSRLFWTICGDGGYTTQSHVWGNEFGTFCPEVEKEIVPPVSYWAALIVKIKLWWKYWLPTPRIPFLSFVISWNPIIPLRPNNDNPNYIIQMGNVFGFIISGENVLRVGIKTSTLPFSLFYAIFHSQYLITRRYYYGLWISNFSIQWSVFCSTN